MEEEVTSAIKKHTPSGNIKETTLIREVTGDHKDFVKGVAKSFMDNFMYDLDARISRIKKQKAWYVTERKLPILKNILIKSVEHELEKHNLRTINSETNKTVQELNTLIDNAKKDLEYIKDEVEIKADEEFRT